jgi:hypothetical protein
VLIETLDEVGLATEELRGTLPFVNDPALRPHVEALANGAARVIANCRGNPGGGPGIADNLAGLLSAARALRVPAQDQELGRTTTLQSLRVAKGLIVAALVDALEAAEALGLRPRPQAAMMQQLSAEVPRVGNAGLLRALATRLDELVGRLDALDNVKVVPTNFAPQTGLLDFYVDAMRVEVDVAKMHLAINDATADFGALTRAVEVMTELTGDFVTTVRAWVGRVSVVVIHLAAEVNAKVRRIAAGARTAVNWISRKARPARAAPTSGHSHASSDVDRRRDPPLNLVGIGYRLPDASVQQLSGLIDSLTEAPYHGRADLPLLADEENLVMDELFPLIETLQLLGFAHVSAGDIELTALGRTYAEADMLARKQLFAEAVLKHIPLAAHIRRVLDERPGHRAPAARFLRELEDHLSESEAQRVLDTVINWGRHAEIFSYDSDTEVLNLENF